MYKIILLQTFLSKIFIEHCLKNSRHYLKIFLVKTRTINLFKMKRQLNYSQNENNIKVPKLITFGNSFRKKLKTNDGLKGNILYQY